MVYELDHSAKDNKYDLKFLSLPKSENFLRVSRKTEGASPKTINMS